MVSAAKFKPAFKLKTGCNPRSREVKAQQNFGNVQVLQPGTMSKNDIIIRGICSEIQINVLLDTGASASLVSTRLIDQLDMMDKIQPTKILIAGLGKKIIPMRGEIKLQIGFANMKIWHTFIVSDNIDEEILAGTDIMRKTEMLIDIPNKVILTPQGCENFLDKPVSLSGKYKVKCNKTFTIPANSVGHLVGKIEMPSTKLNYEGVITGYNKLAEMSGVCVQGALAYSNRNLVPIQCINLMPYEVTIYRNNIVAFIEPFDKKEGVHGVHRVRGKSDFYDATLDIPRLDTAESEEITREKGKWDNPQELLKQLKVDEIDISPSHKEQLKDLLIEYSHCFSRNRFDLGKASFFEAKLDLKQNYVAKWVPSRPISYKMKHHMDEEVHNLIETGQIEPCKYSKWNSCVFLVGKPDGKSYRLVQDMRQMNTQTLPDNYPLPRIDTIMNKMTDNNYLSVFDFLKGFVQVGLEEESRPLTAFTYDDKRYQWARLVMGQTSSSSQFARCMAQLFANVPFNALISYLDDILVGSKTVEEHLKRLRFIFERLSWGNLRVSPRKCQIMTSEVKFLGHRISRQGLRIDEDRIKAVHELAEPKNQKQLQQFLGVMNYMRSFIYKFAEIAAPLYELLKKNVSFNWTDECKESFQKLKTVMTRSPILAIPDVQDKLSSYQVTIDSSKKGHGGVLSQIVDGKRRIISYFSKGVPSHLKKLGATRLEFLGLYYALKHWRLYLEGANFCVLTDCTALLNLETIFKNENSYYQRRLAELSGFRFTIKHVSGKSEQIKLADMLSRYPFDKAVKNVASQTDCSVVNSKESESVKLPQKEISESKTVLKIRRALEAEDAKIKEPVTLGEIKSEYQNDRDLATVIEWLETGTVPENISYRKNPAQICHYWQNINLLKFQDGVLYRKWIVPSDRTKDHDQIVVPGSLIERTLYTYHDASCHSGVETALELCRRKFYFYKMKREFKLYCNACIVCAKNKQPQAFKRAPLKPIVYSNFNQCISVDFNEPSKMRTKRGHVALLTIVDMYSNYLVCKPVKSTSSEEAIKIIINEWVLKFGAPTNILHDLGSHFTSALFKEMLKVFDIKDTHGTPWHSQTQGRVEAFNKKINVAMRVSLNDEQWQEYDKWINFIVFTLNCLKSTKTGYSANFLVFSRELAMPRDIFVSDNERIEEFRSEIDDRDYTRLQAYNLYRQATEVTRKVVANSATKAKYMKTQYDKKVKGPYMNKGDLCLLLIDVPNHKFADRFKGPYLIEEKINNWNYIVNVDGKLKMVNISKLKAYKPNKYSKVTAEDLKQQIGQPKAKVSQSSERTGQTANVPARRRTETSSSSDSSGDEYIIVTRSRGKRRTEREKRRNSRMQNSATVVSSTSMTCTGSDQGQTTSSERGEMVVIDDQNPSILTGQSDNEHDPLDQDTDAVETSEPDVATDRTTEANVPENEAVNDIANRPNATGQGDKIKITKYPAIAISAVDDTRIKLSDIEEYERRSTRSRVNKPSVSGLQGATTLPNLASGSDSGSGGESSRQRSTKYELRQRPKQTKFLGSPISSLKGKISRKPRK